jgi:hypothetical protein
MRKPFRTYGFPDSDRGSAFLKSAAARWISLFRSVHLALGSGFAIAARFPAPAPAQGQGSNSSMDRAFDRRRQP